MRVDDALDVIARRSAREIELEFYEILEEIAAEERWAVFDAVMALGALFYGVLCLMRLAS